jgi:hypothetical protein
MAMCRPWALTHRRSVAATRVATLSAVLISAIVGLFAASLLRTKGQVAGFQVHDLQGSVAYVDGGVVPVEMMLLKFFPEPGRDGVSNTSMPVTARVDTSTGLFQGKWVSSKTEHKAAPIMWRAVILSGDLRPLAEEVVPREYGDVKETPLLVAMNENPLVIRLRRPSSRKQ